MPQHCTLRHHVFPGRFGVRWSSRGFQIVGWDLGQRSGTRRCDRLLSVRSTRPCRYSGRSQLATSNGSFLPYSRSSLCSERNSFTTNSRCNPGAPTRPQLLSIVVEREKTVFPTRLNRFYKCSLFEDFNMRRTTGTVALVGYQLETGSRRPFGDGPLQLTPFENQVLERNILEIFGAANRHHPERTIPAERFRAVERTICHL